MQRKFLLVDVQVLPEVFIKVVRAKELLASGAAANISGAARQVGLSRSAFYKYKDCVFDAENSREVVTVLATLLDETGALQALLAGISDAGASIVVKDGQVMGNLEYMADVLQQTVGGDLFRIETVEEYPLDHDPLVDQAAVEQDEEARPELSVQIENPDQYDTILLGYPNWWGDMPMPLYTFLEEYDFSGKTIIPFTAHGGSGFSDTVSTISELQPSAEVSSEGLSISRNAVADAEDEISSWAAGLGL